MTSQCPFKPGNGPCDMEVANSPGTSVGHEMWTESREYRERTIIPASGGIRRNDFQYLVAVMQGKEISWPQISLAS